MRNNHCRQSSKTRILLQLIDDYQTSPKHQAYLMSSKFHSIEQIEKKFSKSEVNKTYIFPRVQEIDLQQEQVVTQNENQKNNFKELLKKIYVTNQKKSTNQQQLKQEIIKKQYSILQTKKYTNQTTRLQISHSQKKLNTDTSLKQLSFKQSRGQSPDSKPFDTSRSISTQLMKFVTQKKKEIQQFTNCKSFEGRKNMNLSPQLLQNKSFDFSKSIYKIK